MVGQRGSSRAAARTRARLTAIAWLVAGAGLVAAPATAGTGVRIGVAGVDVRGAGFETAFDCGAGSYTCSATLRGAATGAPLRRALYAGVLHLDSVPVSSNGEGGFCYAANGALMLVGRRAHRELQESFRGELCDVGGDAPSRPPSWQLLARFAITGGLDGNAAGSGDLQVDHAASGADVVRERGALLLR
jgi:hypothetical protein